jgi:putative sigma-54 modulation protein
MSRKSKAAEFLEETYNITITGRHVDVTEPLRDYVLEKIAKIERFSHHIIDVVVALEAQKLEHRVDIVAKIDNTKIKAQASTDNMYASIDKAVDKLETQLKKYKNKLHDHHGLKAEEATMKVNILRSIKEDEVNVINDEIEEESRRRLIDKYHPHKIVDKEVHSLKTLADGEAILKMDLSGDAFMVYRSEEDRGLRVIYRRDDGDFGVIEAQV